MTDPDKVTPPSDTPGSSEPEDTTNSSYDVDETALAAELQATGASEPTVAEGEPAEVLDTVPPGNAAEAVAPEASTSPRRGKPATKPADAPSRYAIIKTGGKQYRVKVGDRIQVERLHAEAGTDVTLDEVLMLGGVGSTLIGTPVVEGASVTAHVDEHARGEKIVVFKFKAKKRYRRRTGHRQELTRLTITGISG